MNFQTRDSKSSTGWKSKGFALVVTLSLMILLTLIAVGMLSLSAVSLRSSSQSNAMAEARANARLALMFAIGDLQKHAGADRAITATSEIISAAPAKPHTAGIWESWWDFDPNASPDYSTQKTDRFRRWLVSSADVTAPQSRDFVTRAWSGKTIELVGNNSLGTASATAADKVTAGLVPVSKNSKVQGSYGWHVADESVKARINLYRDPNQNATLAQKRALLAGHRPDPSVMKDSDGSLLTSLPTDLVPAEFAKATASVGKVINLDQAELLDQAKGKIKPFRNDITPHSLGVLADVRGGGLKQDLSSIFEMGSATANTLPADFTNKKLYQSTHGITGISDPNWSALAGYYNTFRSPNLTTPDTNPTFAVKPVEVDNNIQPPELKIPKVPKEYNPTPAIAKVDIIFSMVARPLSNMAFWIADPNGCGGTYDHMVTLIVTPVVTLHNPYNVNISFQKMHVEFANMPVGFNFMFQNGSGGGFASQSVDAVNHPFECFNTMAYKDHKDPDTGIFARNNKRFSMIIADWTNDNPDPNLATSTAINSPIIMKPGQTLICGPTLPSKYTSGPRNGQPTSFDNDTKAGSYAVGFDWEGDLLKAIKARPRFSPGIGFEVSAVTISSFRSSIYNTGSLPGKPNFFPGAWRGHPFTGRANFFL